MNTMKTHAQLLTTSNRCTPDLSFETAAGSMLKDAGSSGTDDSRDSVRAELTTVRKCPSSTFAPGLSLKSYENDGRSDENDQY